MVFLKIGVQSVFMLSLAQTLSWHRADPLKIDVEFMAAAQTQIPIRD